MTFSRFFDTLLQDNCLQVGGADHQPAGHPSADGKARLQRLPGQCVIATGVRQPITARRERNRAGPGGRNALPLVGRVAGGLAWVMVRCCSGAVTAAFRPFSALSRRCKALVAATLPQRLTSGQKWRNCPL